MSLSSTQPKRRREDDNSPPKALTMPGDICKHCNKKCTVKGKNSKAIQCDICYVWVHASCESFSREQYKSFSDLSKSFPNLAYCCKLNGCFTRLNQLIARKDTPDPLAENVLENLEKNYSSVHQTITTISKNINQLSLNNTKLENKVNNLAKSIESSGLESTVNNLAKSIESSLAQPKPPRLGQKQTSRPRSLLLKLSNETSRNQVLSQAPKLRFSNTWNQIYIQPDMTPTEREAYRKLQEEIRRRKSLGESNLIIRNGKITQYVSKRACSSITLLLSWKIKTLPLWVQLTPLLTILLFQL